VSAETPARDGLSSADPSPAEPPTGTVSAPEYVVAPYFSPSLFHFISIYYLDKAALADLDNENVLDMGYITG
ncbi:unnamed protein product, partial [marine sediment metagenome]